MLTLLNIHRLTIASTVLLAQIVFYYSGSDVEFVPNVSAWSVFPAQIPGWRAIGDLPVDPIALDTLKPDDYLNRDYTPTAGSGSLSLFVAYFKTMREGRAPHSPEACLPGTGWASVSVEMVPLPVPGQATPVRINQYVVERDGNRLLVLYWYQLGDRNFTSQVAAQLYALPRLLFHGRTDIALVRIITPVVDANMEAAREMTYRFGTAVYPLVVGHLL